MTTTTSTAKTDRDCDHPGADHWPVFARLPDVSDQLPPVSRRTVRSSAAGTPNYRFDPPEQPAGGSRLPRVSSIAAATLASTQENVDATRQPPQPHVFNRASRVDDAARATRRKSRILPRSDLFSVPDGKLPDALGPLVHFAVLVVLFTAAGTFVLTIGKRNQPMPKDTSRNTISVQQTLQPAAPLGGATLPFDDTLTTTVTGPAGSAMSWHGEPPVAHFADAGTNDSTNEDNAPNADEDASATAAGVPSPAPDPRDDLSTRATFDSPDASADSQAPELELPLPPLSDEDSSPWPQARTSDPPRAVARLQGIVEEVPTRQAQHDDDQSSVH